MYNVKCKITALSTLYAAHACKHLSPSCAIQQDPDYPRMAPQHRYLQEILNLMCNLYAYYVHLLVNVIACSSLWVYFMHIMQRAA